MALITLKIKFKSNTLEEFIERYSVDLSRGGIFVRTKKPLATGSSLHFEFQLNDASPLLAGEGTVAWTREPPGEGEPARAATATPGMGVRFDRLDGASELVLDRILQHKEQRGEGLVESRYDVGLRETRGAMGVIDDTRTPLPPPMPGLEPPSRSSFSSASLSDSPFGEDSTRVMDAGQAEALAARSRTPSGEQPLVHVPEALVEAATPVVEAAPASAEPPAASSPPGEVTPEPPALANETTAASALAAEAPPSVLVTPSLVAENLPPLAPPSPAVIGDPLDADSSEPSPTAAPAPTAETSGAAIALAPMPSVAATASSSEREAPASAPLSVVTPPPPIAKPDRGPASIAIPEHERPHKPPGSTKRFPFLSVALILLVVGAGAYIYPSLVHRDEHPTKPPAAPVEPSAPVAAPPETHAATGIDVQLESTPPGASVTIDGVAAGTTPGTARNLDPGKPHTVVYALPGYKPWSKQLQALADTPFSATLTPTDKYLEVRSTPPGAKVLLDGKPAGSTSPVPLRVRLSEPVAGHQLVLRHAGFLDDSRTLSTSEPFEHRGDEDVLTIEATLHPRSHAVPLPKLPKAPTEGTDTPPPEVKPAASTTPSGDPIKVPAWMKH